MRNAKTPDRRVRGGMITLRADTATRALIDRVAAQLGKNRSELLQDAARREATTVSFDQRLLLLDDNTYGQFIAALDRPPTENRRLRRILTTKAAWEQ